MMVKEGAADAMVAGAGNPTSLVLRSAFSIIGTKPTTSIASSYFIMHLANTSWGEHGYLLFSDCATIPNPDAEQLAEIANTSADSFSLLLQVKPVVALLSFSAHGSASDEWFRRWLTQRVYLT